MTKPISPHVKVILVLGVFLAALGPVPRSKAGSITLLPSASGDYVQPFGQPAYVDQSFEPVTSTTSGVSTAESIFSLSSLPPGGFISSATLNVSVLATETISSPLSAAAYSYNETNGVADLGDFTQGHSLVSAFTGLPANLSLGQTPVNYSFDVTALIQSELNASSPYAGFQFAYTGIGQGGLILAPPSLVLVDPPGLVPEPPAGLLMGIGIAGVSFTAWAKRRAVRARAANQGTSGLGSAISENETSDA
jgi:hypothetical protein